MTMGCSVVIARSTRAVEIGVLGSPQGLAQILAGFGAVLGDRLHDGVGEDQLQLGDVLHEVAHVVVGGIRDDVLGGPDLDDATVLHDRDTGPEADRFIQIVGDEQGGLVQLLGELEELVLQLAPDQGIEGAEGLVHEEHVGVRGERAREPHPLLHAAGELGRKTVLEAVETDHREHALGDLPAAQLRLAPDLQRIGHVVAHRAVRKERHVLKDHADLPRAHIAERRFREAQHVLAEQGDGAGGRLDQTVDVAYQGRLAAPRQAHDAEDLAAPHVEGDVRDADHGIETLEDLRLAEVVAANLVHDLLGPVAEDLPHAFEHDCGSVHGVSCSPPQEMRRAGSGRSAGGQSGDGSPAGPAAREGEPGGTKRGAAPACRASVPRLILGPLRPRLPGTG